MKYIYGSDKLFRNVIFLQLSRLVKDKPPFSSCNCTQRYKSTSVNWIRKLLSDWIHQGC